MKFLCIKSHESQGLSKRHFVLLSLLFVYYASFSFKDPSIFLNFLNCNIFFLKKLKENIFRNKN